MGDGAELEAHFVEFLGKCFATLVMRNLSSEGKLGYATEGEGNYEADLGA